MFRPVLKRFWGLALGICFAGLALLLAGPAWARDYTPATVPNVQLQDAANYVSNPDGIISPQDQKDINVLAKQLRDEMGIEVAVVALKSIGALDARSFATDLFNLWGLGQKGKDNGLLIQLVTDPPQRSVVFETGYGLEGVLPDAICFRLQQRYMIPDLSKGNYSAGMLKGVAAVKEYLFASDYERRAMTDQPKQRPAADEELPLGALLILVGLPLLLLMVSLYFKNRPQICPRCGHRTFSFQSRKVVTSPSLNKPGLVVDTYKCSNCGYTDKKNRVIRNPDNDVNTAAVLGGLMGLGRRGPRGGGGFGGFGGGGWGGGGSGGGGSISRF